MAASKINNNFSQKTSKFNKNISASTTYSPTTATNIAATASYSGTATLSSVPTYTTTTLGYVDTYSYYANNSLVDVIITYMTEEEIGEFIANIKEKVPADDDYEFKNAVRSIFDSIRIFSEDFVLEYMELIGDDLVKRKYGLYIKSGQYKKLALYFEANN